MSLRYTGAWMQDGAFNPLVSPTPNVTYYADSWGYNDYGQLGLGNTTTYSSPKQIGSLTDWKVLIAGGNSSYGIKTDGTLWSWGDNYFGQLGLGSTARYSSPKQVGALTNWLSIVSGYVAVLATKTDGTLWTWGRNDNGQLGLGNTTNYSSPKQVGALTNWSNIASSNYSSYATKTDGTLWVWGYGGYGELGIGGSVTKSSPTQVGALTNWLSVTAGVYFAHAIKTDGTLWAIGGRNQSGQLGLGNITYYSSPKQVGALTNWKSVSNGTYYHATAVKTDGTLWTWGQGLQGQLGLNNTTNYSSPKQVGSLTTWSSSVGGRYYCAAAIKTDGSLWLWGNNTYGQLGMGNVTTYSSPVQLGASSSWKSVSMGYYFSVGLKL